MKRVGALLAVIGLVLVMSPSPAKAAPCTGLLCLNGDGGLVEVPLVERLVDSVTGTVERLVEPAAPPAQPSTPSPVPLPAPSPPARPQAPAPQSPRPIVPVPQTNATPAPAPVIPGQPTEPPVETATPSSSANNSPTGQEAEESGTVEASEPTPPAPVNNGVDSPVVPDDPEVAAVTGSLLGLAIGLACAFLLMFIAYRRGQAAGEEKSINDFLGYIRGTPEPGRHRST